MHSKLIFLVFVLFLQGASAAPPGHGIIPYQATPSSGAPNVILIMTDDVGFGASSTFGGPIPTPTFDELARTGLRYNRFHTTAVCSPSRAALLTGRNHDSVGTPSTMEPRIDSVLPKSAGTIAAVLKEAGYNTAFFGKHHNVPFWELGPLGPFDRWPIGLGFDYFFGFLAGDVDQWAPALHRNLDPVEPPSDDAGYHFERALADDAIGWFHRQQALAPGAPFFIYYAPAAAHSPHHAPKEWMDKFKGRFDQGWDQLREETLARQKNLHVVPPRTRLAERPEGIPAWDSLNTNQRRISTRMMEAFAAQLAYSDHQIGRLLQAIDAAGQLDNTLIIFVQGDNGGSTEGTVQGTMNNIGSYLNGVPETEEYLLSHINEIGGPNALNHFPAGWGWATSAPFRWVKQIASDFGGTRNGMVISWPKGIKAQGEVRSQFHHLIDVMPTILDVVGVQPPETLNGVVQQPIEGVSMAYTFDGAARSGQRRTQYFALNGTKGIYHDGWFAGTVPQRTPWTPFDPETFREQARGESASDRWRLFNIDADFSLAEDLADRYPEKLQEMIDLWASEAEKYGALRHYGIHPSATQHQNRFVFRGDTVRIPEAVAPNFHNRSFSVTAHVDIPPDGGEGVLGTIGSRFGGWGFLIINNRPVLMVNFSEQARHQFRIDARRELAPGARTIRFEFDYDGGMGKGGTGRIYVDDRKVGEGRIERSLPIFYSLTETFDVGRDTGTPLSGDYRLPFHFNGTLDELIVELK